MLWLLNCIDFHQLSPLGRVGHRVAMSVCVSVYATAKTFKISVFCYKLECNAFFLYLQDPEGSQNCMIGSKVTVFLLTFYVSDVFERLITPICKVKSQSDQL